MLDFIFLIGLNIPRGNLVFSININVVFVALSLQHTKNEIIFYIGEHYSKIISMYFIIKLVLRGTCPAISAAIKAKSKQCQCVDSSI